MKWNRRDFFVALRDGILGGLIVGIIVILAARDVHAQTVEQIRRVNPQVLIHRFQDLNEHCQGDPGVDPDTYPACLQRALVEQQLNIAGFERDESDRWRRVRVILTK